MLNRFKFALAVATLSGAVLCGAAPAMAASGLDCVDSGYTVAEQAVMSDFVRDFAYNGSNNAALTNALVGTIAARAKACATEQQWSKEATKFAVFHKMSGYMEQGLRAHGPFDGAKLTKLDQLLVGRSGTIIRDALDASVRAQVLGQPAPGPDAGKNTAMGMAIIAAGLPTDEASGNYIGQIIGARLLHEISGELFAKA